MALLRVVTCDTDTCLALYIDQPRMGPDAIEYAAVRAGWESRTPVIPSRCPSCVTNGIPVDEAGGCVTCRGRTVDLPQGARCLYCGHVTPHPDDDLGPLDDEDDQAPEQERAR